MNIAIKKFLIFPILFLLSGCFSLSNLNHFSYNFFEDESLKIVAPSYSPKWLKDNHINNHLSAIGLSKNTHEKEKEFYKKEVYLSASNNLLNKIYLKSGKLYKLYSDDTKNEHLFEKDIKELAKRVSLKALTYAKVKNRWLDEKENNYYIQLSVDTKILAEIIQENSKQLFDENKTLYERFLSEDAKADIINYLES